MARDAFDTHGNGGRETDDRLRGLWAHLPDRRASRKRTATAAAAEAVLTGRAAAVPKGSGWTASRSLARRYRHLSEEIAELDAQLGPLVAAVAPELIADRALHMIAVSRLAHDERTRACAARRTGEGPLQEGILRCLKRYI